MRETLHYMFMMTEVSVWAYYTCVSTLSSLRISSALSDMLDIT